jgi:hypothetical protein
MMHEVRTLKNYVCYRYSVYLFVSYKNYRKLMQWVGHHSLTQTQTHIRPPMHAHGHTHGNTDGRSLKNTISFR